MKFRFGQPLEQREKTLNDSEARKVATSTYRVTFKGSVENLPILRVSIELPKYRLENGRTRAAQLEYVVASKGKVAASFFAPKNAENEDAQKAQHELLREMLGAGEKDLLKFFSKNKQDQPIILSNKGYVVNGNRRLCAMRQLFMSDAKKFSHFSNIDVVVLPPCDPKDIDELEARLQVIPDIKQDYAWYSLALTFREKVKLYSAPEVARLYNKKPKEIEDEVSRLELAEEYLRSRGKENMYTLLKGQEFAFDEVLSARTRLKKQKSQRDLITQLGFRMIDDPKGGRNYQKIQDAVDLLPTIAKNITEEIIPAKAKAKSSKKAAGDPFGPPDGDGSDAAFAAAAQAVRAADEPQANAVLSSVMGLIAEQKQAEQEKTRQDYVLKTVRDASSKLRQAQTQLHKDSVKEGVGSHLDEIDESVAALRKWLRK